jgi:O-methyltransferase involved in polyketide biosynthesis
MASENARDEQIGPTAHYTAYVWSRLGLPYADLFATPLGAALFWSARGAGEWLLLATDALPTLEQYLEERHKTLDHALAALDPDRVVELGAGLSRRGVTWAVDRDVPYFEVDLPHMIAAKRERLEAAPVGLRRLLEGTLHLEAHDVLDPGLAKWLGETLAGAERPAVVAEGLVSYFEMPEKRRILGSVAEGLRSVGGGTFLCDIPLRRMTPVVRLATEVLYGAIRLVTAGRGAGADFESEDEVRRLFADAGFDEADIVDPTPAVPHLAEVQSVSAIWRARVAG